MRRQRVVAACKGRAPTVASALHMAGGARCLPRIRTYAALAYAMSTAIEYTRQ